MLLVQCMPDPSSVSSAAGVRSAKLDATTWPSVYAKDTGEKLIHELHRHEEQFASGALFLENCNINTKGSRNLVVMGDRTITHGKLIRSTWMTAEETAILGLDGDFDISESL